VEEVAFAVAVVSDTEEVAEVAEVAEVVEMAEVISEEEEVDIVIVVDAALVKLEATALESASYPLFEMPNCVEYWY